MSNDQGNVIEVTETNFPADVVEASKQVPVLLDFWADWCGPCKMLGPVLERLAQESKGTFILGKINVDEQQTLAAQFDVRSIPHVMMFRNGEIVGEFAGAQPERSIRAFLEKHLGAPAEDLVKDSALDDVKAMLAEGNLDAAEKSLQRMLDNEPNNVEADQLLACIFFKREAAHVAAESGEMDGAYHAACVLAAQSRYEDSLAALLTLVEKDKAWREGVARKTMLMVFKAIGPRSQLAEQFRSKLAMALYR